VFVFESDRSFEEAMEEFKSMKNWEELIIKLFFLQ
jgi:hypothetical protein